MTAQGSTLLLVLAALIGLLIGLLLANLSSNKEGKQKHTPPREILKEGYGEVARLWYTPAGRKVLTEMDGGFYKGFNALSADQQAKVLKLIKLWKDWTGEEAAVEETAQAVPVVEERYQPIVPEPVVETEYEDTAYAPAVESVSPFSSNEEEEADLVSVLQQSLEPEAMEEAEFIPSPAADLSITQQIDAILQDMLSTTELSDKGIKLEENLEHGVDVFVGAEKYAGIEDVPYPQVRTLIQEAVKRWEQETDLQQRMGG